MDGFHDQENDGPVTDEADHELEDADIVWNLDMLKDLNVQPHFLATSSPLIHGDLLLLCTSQGMTSGEEAHSDPEAPSFLAVNKSTGKVAWKSNLPGKGILDGQWSSPALGIVNGKPQVVFPASDGWVYSLNPDTGELLWKCDLNPKETIWEEGGTGTRNAIVATPVFHENSVVIGVGQNPDHGDGEGHLWRIDATKSGDVSAETGEVGSAGQANPNSGVIWHYGGQDKDGSVTGEEGESIFFRTISTVAIGEGLLFAADHRGTMHCLDFTTGKRLWIHDMMCLIWGSPLLVDGHVLIGTEDGKLLLFKAGRTESKPIREYDVKDYAAVYATPVIANDHLILVDRANLTKVRLKAGDK
jgi:outer membrane protein assembly factor BamB